MVFRHFSAMLWWGHFIETLFYEKNLSVKYFLYNPSMNEFFNSNLLQWLNPDIIVRSVIIYFFIVWFCIVVWVVRDITNRTRSIFFQVMSIVMVLFLTPLGIFLYLLLRPQKTLFEQVFEDEFFRLDSEFRASEKKQKHDEKKHVAGMDITKK